MKDVIINSIPKYRIPRRQKKAEKRKLIIATDRDMKTAYRGLTKREKKSLKYSVWVMAGVIYHKYSFALKVKLN